MRPSFVAVAVLLLSCAAPTALEPAQIPPPPPPAPSAGASPIPSAARTVTPTLPAGSPPIHFARIPFEGNMAGVLARDGRVGLTAPVASGTYDDPFGRRGIAEEHGTWTSNEIAVPFDFDELIASWNAVTPAGTWIAVEMRAAGGGRMTKWYTLAVWAADDATIKPTTVRNQNDADGRVETDTFVRSSAAPVLTSFQLRVTLHRVAGLSPMTPEVSLVTAVASVSSDRFVPSAFGGTVRDLDVPTLSQELHAGHSPEYSGGGEAWCSPTSTAMILAYFKRGPTTGDLAVFPGPGHADAAVDHAARYTYDWSYRGAGNWPYNTAYAARYGLVGFVTRLRSLVEAERFIAAGIPLVASISGELPGFLFGKTNGHLLVLRGFTSAGDVIANDPAVLSDAQARKTYARADFERVWLGGSGGTVYVMRPADLALPPNVAGVAPNW